MAAGCPHSGFFGGLSLYPANGSRQTGYWCSLPLGACMVHRLVDERVRLRHVFETLLIQDEVGTERVEQNKQVMAAELNRGCGQKDRGFRNSLQ